MKWYLAKMIFRITCGNGNHRAPFDEQLRLLQAGSLEEAFHKARGLGMREEDSFFNRQQQLVHWKFVTTSELYRLDELIDGAELYSRIEETEDAENYLHIVHTRAEQILYSKSNQILNLA